MREKQGLHSSRKDLVFQKMEDIGRVIRKVKERKGGLTTQQKDYVNWLVEQSEKILKWDFSIGDNYYNAMQWLRKVEDTVLDWL